MSSNIKYGTIATKLGLVKIENAALLGRKLNITEVKYGDGGGTTYQPNESQSSLVNVVHSGVPNDITQHDDNDTWISVTSVIPYDVGDFWIREKGLFDEDGDLIFVTAISPRYKPTSESQSVDMTFETMVDVQNVDVVKFIADPNKAIASKSYVDKKFDQAMVNASHTNLLSNHNFLTQRSGHTQPPPSSTPTSYPSGYELFQGVFANESIGITNLTYIDGRVSFSGGSLYFSVPNTGGLEKITKFAASVADFNGKPRQMPNSSWSLVGDNYRVTVGVADLAGGPLGSVKFEQGSVATGHELNYGVVAAGTETPRTLESRFSDLLNIKDYYAHGDDDDVAIAKATAVGKKVYLPEGDYNFSTLINADLYAGNNVTFSGRSQPVSSVSGGKSLGAVRVDLELPIRPSNYDTIIATYSYSFIYPQGMFIDDSEREIFVSFAATGGANSWGWIYVFDLDTGAYKSVFSAGTNTSEGLHVESISGNRILFVNETFSSLGSGQTGAYALPSDLSSVELTRLSPTNISNTGQVYKICGANGQILVEAGISTAPRTMFTYYNAEDLLNETFPTPIGYGDVPRDVLERAKSQNYSIGGAGILVGRGGLFFNGEPKTARSLFGSSLLSPSGALIDEFVADPQYVFDSLSPHLSITPTRIENEGAQISYISGSEKFYTLCVANDRNDAGSTTGGIVILEVNAPVGLSTSIDLQAGVSFKGCKSETLTTYSSYYNEPYNPASNAIMTTWSEIIDYMKSERVSVYSYYNSSEGATQDIDGNNLPPYTSVTIETGNRSTFFVTVQGGSTFYKVRVSGAPYIQIVDNFVFSQSATVRSEFSGRRFIFGRDGLPSVNCYSDQSSNYTAMRFFGGSAASPVPVGNIGFTSTGTAYATTSDPRTKTEFKPHSDAWGDFGKIYDACGVFEFKHAIGKTIVGFDAHKIIDAGINAGVEGEGPRGLSVGDTYAEHWIVNKEGEEELVKFKVTPASVDQSKIVPYLISVIHDLNERLKAVESE